jgi:hypothetical protein
MMMKIDRVSTQLFFFEAFQGLQRDISFMYELAGRTRMMILDKHLTEEALAEYGSK